MKILIYSDPHIGLQRQANMTPDSNRRREENSLKTLSETTEDYEAVFCLGDFFDKVSNPEEVILSAVPIAQQTDIILAGNHDEANRLDKESSLRVISEMLPGKCLIADHEKNDGFTLEIGTTLFCFAPHALTQEAYMDMVDGLVGAAESSPKFRVLCLHCNWDMNPDRLDNATLNLTKTKAEELLQHFHYILIGHVHTPVDMYEGRVKIVGSCSPTAFDNLDSKRMLEYDPDTGTFENVPVWNANHLVMKSKASACHGTADVQYYDLEDDLPPGEAQKLVVSLFKEGAFGVRLRKPEGADTEAVEYTAEQFEKLSVSIEAQIEKDKPHLLALWKELTTGEDNGNL